MKSQSAHFLLSCHALALILQHDKTSVGLHHGTDCDGSARAVLALELKAIACHATAGNIRQRALAQTSFSQRLLEAQGLCTVPRLGLDHFPALHAAFALSLVRIHQPPPLLDAQRLLTPVSGKAHKLFVPVHQVTTFFHHQPHRQPLHEVPHLQIAHALCLLQLLAGTDVLHQDLQSIRLGCPAQKGIELHPDRLAAPCAQAKLRRAMLKLLRVKPGE